ncbi:MAG: hypothetical protein OXE84_11770 [Rhodobacteraceae bacterium]|nr:hypothetical protein [Paracoccaceae bacterium]MCY4197921.1 hypothetical protein [Paracoccaceae bacterium]MCY4326114.1 hypothetical protein [Paracoccaceae bacterium]
MTATEIETSKANSVDNHAKVYISMDMHKLTIGSDLDTADKIAGGLTDPGFDGMVLMTLPKRFGAVQLPMSVMMEIPEWRPWPFPTVTIKAMPNGRRVSVSMLSL